MRKCILDSSICIDLFHGGLVEVSLQLPYTFVIPDVVLSEELNETQRIEFTGTGYGVESLSSEGVSEVLALVPKYVRPSRIDLFALVCTKKCEGILLSGDKSLRKAAEEEKVEVHGLLWVLDGLIDRKLLLPMEARAALIKMLEHGARLPKDDCDNRLKQWKTE